MSSAGTSPSTNEDILNFMAVFLWQHMAFATLSGVCEQIPYFEELRTIALESGNKSDIT